MSTLVSDIRHTNACAFNRQISTQDKCLFETNLCVRETSVLMSGKCVCLSCNQSSKCQQNFYFRRSLCQRNSCVRLRHQPAFGPVQNALRKIGPCPALFQSPILVFKVVFNLYLQAVRFQVGDSLKFETAPLTAFVIITLPPGIKYSSSSSNSLSLMSNIVCQQLKKAITITKHLKPLSLTSFPQTDLRLLSQIPRLVFGNDQNHFSRERIKLAIIALKK